MNLPALEIKGTQLQHYSRKHVTYPASMYYTTVRVCTTIPQILPVYQAFHTPSILGASSAFRTSSTGSSVVLVA